ncbi:TetR/AcrR family transcriptional regulator [Actinomadura chibensis]|uniref:TetR/AcrR family transcriptional regulator n=1 Tax=Actinomadura chibensis TaxID=392828 RepID=A0A5D0NLX8_9ACTN|nr:TetR/AcrR family transcriptional regulator [Actinomadura chibensis]TYB45405.1 TetR/AcrR family transcriptional regulator [Actinomadura chibensis]
MSTSRAALLDAATAEFAKHGLRGARIQDIVARAGVNERMIYHHFGSKEKLYAAALEDRFAELRAAWAPVLEKAVTMEPYEGMRFALSGFADIIMGRPRLVGLWLHEALNGWRTLPLPTADMLPSALSEIYARGQKTGVFSKARPFELAHGTAMAAMFGMAVMAPRGAQILRAGGPELDDDATRRDLVLDQLMNGMATPRAD